MKIVRSILVLLLAAVLLSGCDFFRKIAGRPLSADIEAKRELIQCEQAAHQRRLAALDSLNKHIADSLAHLDSIKLSSKAVIASRPLSQNTLSQLIHQYYIIIGAFGQASNADKAVLKASTEGLDPIIIEYANGTKAVGVKATDKLSEAYILLDQVVKLYPDAWILNNK